MKRLMVWTLLLALISFLSIYSFFGGNFGFKKFRLENGREVECRLKYVNSGMVFLNYCKDKNRYLAQKNVIQL